MELPRRERGDLCLPDGASWRGSMSSGRSPVPQT